MLGETISRFHVLIRRIARKIPTLCMFRHPRLRCCSTTRPLSGSSCKAVFNLRLASQLPSLPPCTNNEILFKAHPRRFAIPLASGDFFWGRGRRSCQILGSAFLGRSSASGQDGAVQLLGIFARMGLFHQIHLFMNISIKRNPDFVHLAPSALEVCFAVNSAVVDE